VHLSVSAEDGADLLRAAPEIVEQGAWLVVSPESELKELVLFSREDGRPRSSPSPSPSRSVSDLAGLVRSIIRRAAPRLAARSSRAIRD